MILELAVVGLPFLSVLRFSGNKLQMNSLKRQIQKMFSLHFCEKRIISLNTSHMHETYYWLLCMSSIRSGKSTSRFLSQKPLISYETCNDTSQLKYAIRNYRRRHLIQKSKIPNLHFCYRKCIGTLLRFLPCRHSDV